MPFNSNNKTLKYVIWIIQIMIPRIIKIYLVTDISKARSQALHLIPNPMLWSMNKCLLNLFYSPFRFTLYLSPFYSLTLETSLDGVQDTLWPWESRVVCLVGRIGRKPERREKMKVVYQRAPSHPVVLCYPGFPIENHCLCPKESLYTSDS